MRFRPSRTTEHLNGHSEGGKLVGISVLKTTDFEMNLRLLRVGISNIFLFSFCCAACRVTFRCAITIFAKMTI